MNFFLSNLDKHTIADSKGLCNPLATGKKNSKNEFFLGIDKLLRTVCCNCVVKIEKEKNVVVADEVVFQFLYKKKWLKIATCKILNPLPMNG